MSPRSAAPVLLITSAIHPASGELVRLSNSDERLSYTLQAIDEWLNLQPELRIVICDGTGVDFAPEVARRWPEATIESLSFHNSADLVAQKGKGFGEGEIIAYALRHSTLLRGEKCFMKCTSKLWVRNIAEVLTSWRGGSAFRLRFKVSADAKITCTEVDTRFFITKTAFYRRHLQTAYMTVERERGYYIEHAYRDRLLQFPRVTRMLFRTEPEVCGMSGTRGQSYTPNTSRHTSEQRQHFARTVFLRNLLNRAK